MSNYYNFWQDRLTNIKITGKQINADCPVCKKTKHFYASVKTGQFDCKVCGITGNAITFLREYENKNNKEIAECLNSYGINENSHRQIPIKNSAPKKVFEQSLVDFYVSNLPEDKLREFSQERGLPIEILKKYKLGMDKQGNFTLPVYDQESRIRDIRRKKIGKDTISSVGSEVFLFGVKDLLSNNRLFLTEGEWSKMALEAQGYPSVGVPGASTFKDEWTPLFKNKEVFVVYDLDSGGENGTKKVINKLRGTVKRISHIKLPKELGEGKDVRDFFNNSGTKEQFEELIREARPVESLLPNDNSTTAAESDRYNFTDLGNAERLVSRHKDNLCFCHPWNKWLCWDGRRWTIDATAEAWRYAMETVRHMYSEAETIEQQMLRKDVGNHALRSESEAKIRAMLSLASKQEDIPVKPKELDKNPLVLNVLNGVVDLQKGELMPHSRSYLITKLAPINYDTNATCPKWTDFLNKIMIGNNALIQYLQRVAGYCLTGKTGEHKLFFLFGSGANGKTTFLKALQGILGDYAIKTASEILIARPVGTHTTSITDLKGARLALTVEVQEGRRLAEALVKELTGGDSITARRMREDNTTFEPTHKIVLAANHKPIVHETTRALWRRIDLIPFNYVFGEEERIKDYHEILLNEERDGIFQWALQGCLEWQVKGLGEPSEVIEATKEYKTEMDVLGDFIADCCVIGQLEEVSNKELRETYIDWCKKNGEKEISSKAFSARLQEKGLIKITNIRSGTSRGRGWKGIGIHSNSDIGASIDTD